jgi:hypothetical protein
MIYLGGAQWKRVFSTVLVGLIFIWFWYQGPLNKPIQLVNLVSNESAFLSPIFIQDQADPQQKKFGLIASEQSHNNGPRYYGLVGKVKQIQPYGLIADPHHQPAMMATVGEAMYQRAILFNSSLTAQLKSALDMFYIELRDQSNKFATLYRKHRIDGIYKRLCWPNYFRDQYFSTG